MNAKEKHVYLFSELDQAEAYAKDGWDSARGLLGGKGANLADMTRLGCLFLRDSPSLPNPATRFWKLVKSSRKECGTRCWKD